MLKDYKYFNQEEEKRCPFPTGYAKVYLSRLAFNIDTLSKHLEKSGKKSVDVLLPIKGNAYGSGAVPIAHFVEKNGLCAYLGVAHAVEAFRLRESGITMPILIMGQVHLKDEELTYIVEKDIELSVSDQMSIKKLDDIASAQKKAKIHLFVDTGMGREGILADEIDATVDLIEKCSNIELVGVMTHFAVSDSTGDAEEAFTRSQIDAFLHAKEKIVDRYGARKIIFHAANSGACMKYHESVFDMVRPGIALYGYPPHDTYLSLKPIMDVTSSVTLVKTYPTSHTIGYGMTYKTEKDGEKIGIVPIGYGDGLQRKLGNNMQAVTSGSLAQCVGRISMDQFQILLPEGACVGDEVVMIGDNSKLHMDANRLAEAIDTIPYEIISAVGSCGNRIRHEYYT